MASLTVIAEQYFSTLNPLAEKISQDVLEVRAAYTAVWESLNEREKTEIINETLIKPELSLRYTSVDPLDLELAEPHRRADLMSVFGREHGQRLVQDEGATYRDEHSAPFLYQTTSQLNLCELVGSRHNEDDKTSAVPLSNLALSHSKVVSELKNALKSHDVLKKKESPQEEQDSSTGGAGFIAKMMSKKVRGRGEDRERLVSPEPTAVIVAAESVRAAVSPRCVNKPDWCEESRGLLASRGSSQSPLGSSTALAGADVRSGFDFLDNW